jgi:hypothetical protein
MKKPQSKRIDYQVKNDQNFAAGNKIIKTTNINILLNRVKQKNKNESKKKIILSISIIAILSLISITTFGN